MASACTVENTLTPTEPERLKITLSLALHTCISVCLCVGYVHVKSEDGIGYPEAGVVGSREMPPPPALVLGASRNGRAISPSPRIRYFKMASFFV